ncbi:MAG: antitoxin VapB family protein [Promethearchaeota archaeon]
MVQKTISLSESVYTRLKARKKPGESFSDLILRLLNTKDPHRGESLEKFFGTLEEEHEGEWDEIMGQLYEDRLKLKKPVEM